MQIQEFLSDDIFKLPKHQSEREDFKRYAFKMFDVFLEKLRTLARTDESFEDVGFSIRLILERQENLIKRIKEALDYYYDGKPAMAYNSIDKGLDRDIKSFYEILNIKEFKANSNFYRMRIYQENFPLKSDDFFHIPFHLRGKVKTQRFSIPGFPSLYLGTSVYVCWEELSRPNINDFHAVRLKNIETISVIDLSPPKGEAVSPYDYYKFLMIWPIVFVSSVKVRDSNDAFKPEYIIPQLLLQWVREKKEIDGIAYQTTHIDFSTSLSEGEFLNVVLPVKEIKMRGLCNSLKAKFEISEATSIQLSQCSTGGGTFIMSESEDNELDKKIKKIELLKGRTFPYSYSILGEFEGTLNHLETTKIK